MFPRVSRIDRFHCNAHVMISNRKSSHCMLRNFKNTVYVEIFASIYFHYFANLKGFVIITPHVVCC